MGNSENSRKYRSEMENRGFKSRNFWLHKDAIEILDKIKKESTESLSNIVGDAITEYGNKHYNITNDCTKPLTLQDISKRALKLKEMIKNFEKGYFKKNIDDKNRSGLVEYLKSTGKTCKELKYKPIYLKLPSKFKGILESFEEYCSFIDAFRKDINVKNKLS